MTHSHPIGKIMYLSWEVYQETLNLKLCPFSVNRSLENPKIYSYQLDPSRFPFFTELAKSTLLENQGAEKIVKKLEVLEKSFDENSDNKLELAACGSMLNVASDDGIVTVESLIVQFSLLIFIHSFILFVRIDCCITEILRLAKSWYCELF